MAILQGNIDQYQKWDRAYEDNIRRTYENLSLKAGAYKPDLIVWPETAVPAWFPTESRYVDWLSKLARETRTYHLAGAASEDPADGRDYNAAFLISPEGEILQSYRKIHLVPFGEFVPFRRLLSPWIRVLNEMGNFSPGSESTVFRLPKASVSAFICFESIFPELVRSFRRSGAQVLVNITNDGWFLSTSAPEQHMAANVLRAVENRAPVVRAANTGISCVIEPTGEISVRTELLKETFVFGEIGPSRDLTFYTRSGDLFAWAAGALTVLFLLGAGFKIRWSPTDKARGPLR